MATEYQCRCNRCGNVWCVSDEEIKNLKRLKAGAALNMLNAGLQAAGESRNTAASIFASHNAQTYSNMVYDPSRCPNCGSINIAVAMRTY